MSLLVVVGAPANEKSPLLFELNMLFEVTLTLAKREASFWCKGLDLFFGSSFIYLV